MIQWAGGGGDYGISGGGSIQVGQLTGDIPGSTVNGTVFSVGGTLLLSPTSLLLGTNSIGFGNGGSNAEYTLTTSATFITGINIDWTKQIVHTSSSTLTFKQGMLIQSVDNGWT